MIVSNNKPSWIARLKNRWGITSTFQVFIILLVFTCTGFTVLYAEEVIFQLLGIGDEKAWWLALLLFLLITLPLYNLILLVYGFIFGQFSFFWNFEKRFFGRMIKPFKKKSSKP
jgi:hypothetical protein